MKKFLTLFLLSIIAFFGISSCGRKSSDVDFPENMKQPRFEGVSDEMETKPEFEKKLQSQRPLQKK